MIKQLLESMTLQEKVGQINQHLYGWEVYEKINGEPELTQKFKDEVAKYDGIGAIYGIYRADPWSGKDLQSGLQEEEGKRLIAKIQQYLKENTRLQIPALISEEVPHGLQALSTTTLPSNISLGQTWNPGLVKTAQAYVSDEVYRRDIHLALVSCLDVSRDQRWGRTEECFSEDPYLSSVYAKHTIEGLQSHNIIAVAKHLCAQGDGVGGLNASPALIGERELREIHLPPFIAAKNAGCRAVMAAYNEIDGVLCHDNSWLLNTISREEIGFDGFVMADGVALDRLAQLAGSKEKAAARALKAGVDLSLWDDVYTRTQAAVEEGYVDEQVLDQAVIRILEAKEHVGLFNPITDKKHETQTNPVLKLTEESIVMVKNDNHTCPLQLSRKIALIGPNAHNVYNSCGDYTPFKEINNIDTIYDALKRRTDVKFEMGSRIAFPLEGGIEAALEIAREAETIVMCLGGSSTRDFNTEFDKNGAALEGSSDMTCGENIDQANLGLPQAQKDLVSALATLGKPMILVLIQGRQHAIHDIEEAFDTIFVAGYPGEMTGQAVSNLLFGKANPSGKLAMNIPANPYHRPSYYNFKKSEQNEHYHDYPMNVRYPFGHGLSYTQFEMNHVALNTSVLTKNTQAIDISLELSNVGNMVGQEVVQIYLHHKESSVIQRVKMLKGFAKVTLQPNEKKHVTIRLNREVFEVWGQSKSLAIEQGTTVISVETTDSKEIFHVVKEGIQTW